MSLGDEAYLRQRVALMRELGLRRVVAHGVELELADAPSQGAPLAAIAPAQEPTGDPPKLRRTLGAATR